MAFANVLPNEEENQNDFEKFKKYDWKKKVQVILDYYGHGINEKSDIKSGIIYLVKKSIYFASLCDKEQVDDITTICPIHQNIYNK